ncbi:MAG TPA: 4Fe-4S binding protein [Epulopiscium sp.]|nr:4Fe-4S binding protein [Candidatus Epulonipiscium sp.]
MEDKVKRKSKKIAKVDKDYCVACGACVKECKFGAIKIKKGVYAKIDKDKCVGCGKCAKICPASVIQMIKRGETDGGEK